jgi:PTS system nitrogen regulatory IIA component
LKPYGPGNFVVRLPHIETMILQNLITPENVLCNVQARSKKHCLEILSELLAHGHPELDDDEIFSRLAERERLGCTSLENGVAFPHCRMRGIESASAALMKLADPLEFDSPDGKSVDLVLGLIVPDEVDESHHFAVDEIADVLRDEALRRRLRRANSNEALYDAIKPSRDFKADASQGGA